MTLDQPILHLAPHELSPHRRAKWDGEALDYRAHWQGRERQFITQIVSQNDGLILFFALTNEPERSNFVSAPVWVSKDKKRLPHKCEPRTQFATTDIPEILPVATENEGWGRLYYLDQNLNLAEGEAIALRLFLAPSGWGQWSPASGIYQTSACFQWHTRPKQARELALLAPLELLSRVREKLLNSQSDAARAREFLPLSKAARHENCRSLTRGSYKQWRQVLSWVLRVYFPSETAQKGWLQLYIHNALPEHLGDIWMAKGERRSLSSNLSSFWNWTSRYFESDLDADYVNSCFAAQEWFKRSFYLTILACRPTQHERLEALLRLRNWLRDKATPPEIEALLRAE